MCRNCVTVFAHFLFFPFFHIYAHTVYVPGSSDFSSTLLDTRDVCYNPAGAPPEIVKKSLLTVCPIDVAFCTVSINRIAGVFSGIVRFVPTPEQFFLSLSV